MSLSLKLDSNNNLQVGSAFITIGGVDSLVQDIRNRLSLVAGEYPFDITQGVDYFTLLSQNNKTNIKNAIINEIKKDNRVSEVELEDMLLENNTLRLNIKITTIDGVVVNV